MEEQLRPLQMADMSEEDRPREKALLSGLQSLSTAELLAILLGSGTSGMSAVALAQHILKDVDQSLVALSQRSIKNLVANYKGVGEAKAITILAAMEIGRRYRDESPKQAPQITSPEDAYGLMQYTLADLDHEEFWIAYLNAARRVTKKERISQGGLTSTVVDAKIVVRHALDEQATALILYHNHPSGNMRPSKQDDKLTQTLRAAAKLFDIQVLDHIIVTRGGYYSYLAEDRFDEVDKMK